MAYISEQLGKVRVMAYISEQLGKYHKSSKINMENKS